jgi:hypothetical protein
MCSLREIIGRSIWSASHRPHSRSSHFGPDRDPSGSPDRTRHIDRRPASHHRGRAPSPRGFSPALDTLTSRPRQPRQIALNHVVTECWSGSSRSLKNDELSVTRCNELRGLLRFDAHDGVAWWSDRILHRCQKRILVVSRNEAVCAARGRMPIQRTSQQAWRAQLAPTFKLPILR